MLHDFLQKSDPIVDSTQPPAGKKELTTLLESIVRLDEREDELAREIKLIRDQSNTLKEGAIAMLEENEFDGLRAAGKSWHIRTDTHLSVSAADRSAVLAIAETLGIRDAINAISMPTLKSLLKERALERGVKEHVAGTEFEGLITEFNKRSLISRSAS